MSGVSEVEVGKRGEDAAWLADGFAGVEHGDPLPEHDGRGGFEEPGDGEDGERGDLAGEPGRGGDADGLRNADGEGGVAGHFCWGFAR